MFKILALLSPFCFLISWQHFVFAPFFLFFSFYGIFVEFKSFLQAKKQILKTATILEESLFYKLTNGNFFIYFMTFFLSLFCILSLFVNLLNLESIDYVFLFVFLPLFLLIFKKSFFSQFKKNAYNDFRIIIFTSFLIALIYALFKLFFIENQPQNLSILSDNIKFYKGSKLLLLDKLSYILNMLMSLKLFLLYYLGNFYFKLFSFIFDFMNFFILSSIIAYLYNYCFKLKFKFLILSLSLILCTLSLYTIPYKNAASLDYNKELIFLIDNLQNLKEQNLSKMQENTKNLNKQLKEIEKVLNKNTYELFKWWFSDEKKELQKMLRDLNEI
ncbi:hypothetical protein FMM56_02575 [Campylobacter sp. LR264d]|nr:hypothetical protein FMM56_02575 [Campylobacter sp. LR264d]